MLRSFFFPSFFYLFSLFWGEGGWVGESIFSLCIFYLYFTFLLAAGLVLDRELSIVCLRNFVCLRRWLIAWFPRNGSRIF